MQFLLNQEEYNEFMSLRKMFENRGKKSLSEATKRVYELYLKNPLLTYEQAGQLLNLSPAGVFKNINNLCKR